MAVHLSSSSTVFLTSPSLTARRMGTWSSSEGETGYPWGSKGVWGVHRGEEY